MTIAHAMHYDLRIVLSLLLFLGFWGNIPEDHLQAFVGGHWGWVFRVLLLLFLMRVLALHYGIFFLGFVLVVINRLLSSSSSSSS